MVDLQPELTARSLASLESSGAARPGWPRRSGKTEGTTNARRQATTAPRPRRRCRHKPVTNGNGWLRAV